jgi:hypothetical protein
MRAISPPKGQSDISRVDRGWQQPGAVLNLTLKNDPDHLSSAVERQTDVTRTAEQRAFDARSHGAA